ncbi:MAG: J domain-containing protein [Synergistaceae bacterium]|nr:J domain-containing protein [Synergistaceae bacterium]
MPNADHYAVLGLPLGANKEEVRSAYRRLVKLYHPDRDTSPEAAARYHQIRVAYETLRKDAVFPGSVWQTPPSWERAAPSASSQASSSSSWSSARGPSSNAKWRGKRFVISDAAKEALFESLHENRGCGIPSVFGFSMAVILLFLAFLILGIGSISPR